MNYKMKDRIPLYKLVSIFLLAVIVLSACASPTPTPAPTQDVAEIQTQAAQSVINDLTAVAPTPMATLPPAPGPTPSIEVASAIIPTPVSGDPAAIANYNTYIFSGPGENYVVYSAFLGGQQAVVVGKSEDASWWVIRVPVSPTGTGWVSAGWVTVVGVENVPVMPTPPVPPTTDLVPPAAGDPQAVALVNTYVRTGPGENFPAYGIAPAGVLARIIAKSEDGQWWSVRLDPTKVGAGNGWVMAAYVQASNVENVVIVKNPPAPSAVVPVTPPAGAPTATALDYINVRSGPGTQYTVLAVAAPGAVGEVSGVSADKQWWQVKIPTQFSPDGFGWVSASYVLTTNTDGVPEVSAPPAPEYPQTPPTVNQCTLLAQTPADYTEMGPDVPFNTTWTLQNTGTVTWTTAYDVRFLGADVQPFHQGADIYDFVTNVEPGWNYDVTIPMVSPSALGPYGEAWAIYNDSGVNICTFWIYINLK